MMMFITEGAEGQEDKKEGREAQAYTLNTCSSSTSSSFRWNLEWSLCIHPIVASEIGPGSQSKAGLVESLFIS